MAEGGSKSEVTEQQVPQLSPVGSSHLSVGRETPIVWVNPIPMECGLMSLGSEKVVPRFTLSVSIIIVARGFVDPCLNN